MAVAAVCCGGSKMKSGSEKSKAASAKRASLEKRVAYLERMVEGGDSSVEDMRVEIWILASQDAMLQLAQEILQREGVDPAVLKKRFRAARRWHIGRYMKKAEDISPDFAAHLDDRPYNQVSTEDESPRILPPNH